ncbi:hypothetical protein HP439_12365 [Sphingobacterium shayense]|uniref:hypothetical protein n=1 Tax=Sphingobacterium shayense TaxID=626343 RepID=UPI001555BFEF|nr:hypothetical protein [Sphingobacterium shayense]NQD71518.1 hypothetical protein [Sphingobacterium shayense]
MPHSIKTAQKFVKIYYGGQPVEENEQTDLFEDPAMLKRFQDIATLPEKEKECLLTTVNHFIKVRFL